MITVLLATRRGRGRWCPVAARPQVIIDSLTGLQEQLIADLVRRKKGAVR